MPETPEHKAVKQLIAALDRNSFQPWAFAAVMTAQDPDLQIEFMRTFIAVMDSWIARDDNGLSNYPQHVKLADYSRKLRAVLDTLPPV